MTIYDVVILAVVGLFAVWGLLRGLIRETFDAAGVIVGVLAARQFAPTLGAVLPPSAVPQLVRTIVASIIIIIGVWVAAKVSCVVVRKVIRHGPVKPLDRLGGALVGALKGALLVLAAAMLLAVTPVSLMLSRAERDSTLLHWTMTIARPLAERYRDVLAASIKKRKVGAMFNIAPTAEEAAQSIKSGIAPDKLSLDDISPETIDLIQQLLDDPALQGIDVEIHAGGIKFSTPAEGQIKPDQLSPETRRKVAELLNDPALERLDIERLIEGMGVELDQLSLPEEAEQLLKGLTEGQP